MDRRSSYFLNRQLIDGLHKMLSSDRNFVAAVPRSVQWQLLGDLLKELRREQLRNYKPRRDLATSAVFVVDATASLPGDLSFATGVALGSAAGKGTAVAGAAGRRPFFQVYSKVRAAEIWPLVKRGHEIVGT